MNKFIKKNWFIGVDISNDTLDLGLLNEKSHGTFKEKKVKNSFSGFDKIMEWLEKEKIKLEDCMFCMEHTGTYGLLFFAWLSQMEFDYCVEPGIQIKSVV